jgi:hypothetical protein
MKYIIMLVLIVTAGYSQDTTHFRIYADIQNNSFFKGILKQTRLDDVFTRKYQIVVNTKPDYDEAFIVIGRFESPDAEFDREAYRYDWLFLSRNLREQLLKYPHKILIH